MKRTLLMIIVCICLTACSTKKETGEESFTKITESHETDSTEESEINEPVSIFSKKEEESICQEAMKAADLCSDIYLESELINPDSDYAYRILTEDQRHRLVDRLGEEGFVSAADDMNMENYEQVNQFYSEYISGKDSMVTIFKVYESGILSSQTFACRNGSLQFYYVGMEWNRDGNPEIIGCGINELESILLTEKGYFIYRNAYVMEHASFGGYFRVEPLSEMCRQLTKKYVKGLSYLNYNMLVTNWDEGNVTDILMPCMFEDIYRIYTGENLKVEDGRIPAGIYEQIMTTYFPVTTDELRKCCGYNADKDSYKYERIRSKPYPVFGEVVDYRENDDGTWTLIVDGVRPDFNEDCVYKNKLVVCPFEDGTFKYVSNNVEKK
ncbi:DUF6070 family protein [Frisingicoccus sp.]|uniref:DUF6070 family protein n=1 Tax=Frisingicoccus sp. TaxID=1918627 RepID=UPI002A813B31|nr:DUF6070 family protein [Frisingicoccus sp.]MDY4834724.1 DUF6070 family protein [Frisingicoccus sp.]MDY4921847.1 DUF6070 family protein [Frisingicoccus sp.]